MSSDVVIIDLDIGNLSSVIKAVEKAGGNPVITSNPELITEANRLILPGVGAFIAGMNALSRLNLIEPLKFSVLEKKTPILGLCMGMQLFASYGHEDGSSPGLNFIDGVIEKIEIEKCLRLPHVGWNNIEAPEKISLFSNLAKDPHFYFVHSYHYASLGDNIIRSYSHFNEAKVVAAIEYRNIYGFQFHPEKSLENGILVFKNFLSYA